MMKAPVRFLAFLKVVDEHDGAISLTNIALIVCIFKLALLRTFELPDLAAFMGVLISYSHKRLLGSKTQDAADRLGAVEKAVQDASVVAVKAASAVQTVADRLTVVDNRTRPLGGR